MYKTGDRVRVKLPKSQAIECLLRFNGMETEIARKASGRDQYHLKGCMAENGRHYFFLEEYLEPIKE